MKRFLKISGYITAGIFLLLLAAVALVNYSPVQTYLARKAAGILSDKLETRVTVATVQVGLLNRLFVQGVYIEGKAKDTLLYAGQAELRITDWFVFKDKPVIHYLGLENTFVHLYRNADSKVWNYDFILDLFSTPKKKKKKDSQPIEIDLRKVELKNVRFHMDDRWVGSDMDIDVGYLLVDADGIDYGRKLVVVDKIEVRNAGVFLREYGGGRPEQMRHKHIDTFDRTPFNPENWGVKANAISLVSCSFRLSGNDHVSVPGLFDENHLDVKGINLDVTAFNVAGDTIHGNINNLTGEDRCGLAIKKMHSKVTLSPVASVCENLYLETNHSTLQDYYAMHYKHFPNFLDYIDSVQMVAHLRNARIDKRDLMYFAPELANLPEIQLSISGDGKGTVSDISVTKLSVSDGNIALKGNITMKGLPDIYSTRISYTDGEILTTRKGIMHYAPQLKGNPDFAADSITYALFMGSYEGYLERFRVQGVFKTNLGTVATDMNMSLPGFNPDSAFYSGIITTDKLQLGTLLRQTLIGDITMNEKVSGYSFNPEDLQMHIDGVIKEFMVNGYRYHNITTQGTLAKKQFDGKLLVDDPNLALTFDGGLNYAGKQVKINATAHLLGSNFKALKLTGENITASADFDLDWTGSSIDNFSGYGKLFNINMKRDAQRLVIDSVYVRSDGDSTHRRLTVLSDAFTASISGNYRLSNLPASVQYYLSRYLPNYIKAPEQYAPDQDLSFKVTTTSVDSILVVTVPTLRGFDSVTISGSLNTSAKKLTLNAFVPYGSIGNVFLNNVTVTGEGDFNIIALSTNVENIALGDSVLYGALSLTTTIGNDSVAFTLATVSPDQENSIALNGRIVATNDTLRLNILPSQFFMKKARWDITGGSNIVYSHKYLFVQGLSVTSGLQRISADTKEGSGQPLVINTENIDLSVLSNMAALSGLQPDGRVSGTVEIGDIFNNLVVSANMKATGVRLGADTVGYINLVGSYEMAKKLIRIDPQTGIFRDNASVVASGTISLDSTVDREIDGTIKFSNARVAWATPFLTGLMSNLSGTVNGSVDVWGSHDKPVIDGKVSVADAALRLDYMGCNYTIPKATVTVTNKRITLGQVQLFDRHKNMAVLSGYFTHDLFDNMRMRLKITTPKFEVMNLARGDNDMFYGKLVAGMDSFTIRGAFNNIRLNLYNGAPAAKSTLFIPSSTGSYVGSYNYVTFKTYGTDQENIIKKRKDKISINLDINLNTLAEIHIVLDPATEDEIVATGYGNIQMDIPPNNDMRMTGLYTINNGTYTLTFQQLAIHRQFRLNPGSTIGFNGPFADTKLDVHAVYQTKARLYDLLTDADKPFVRDNELIDAQTPQVVNVTLHMKGPIYNSLLTFDIDLDNKHSQGSLAYRKLMIINNDDRQKFDQVASLLLIGAFIPPEGIGQNTALSGAINNVSQLLSSTASAGLTNIVNKMIGDRKLNVAVRYTNYNYNDQLTVGNVNRNQLKLGVSKNYLNDRLLVTVGSTSDWGRPATTGAASNFNIAGDFRLQYLLSQNSGLRLNAFQTSDYDLTRDQNIQRRGMGISWRKSFDNLGDFFRGNKYARKMKEKQMQAEFEAIKDTTIGADSSR